MPNLNIANDSPGTYRIRDPNRTEPYTSFIKLNITASQKRLLAELVPRDVLTATLRATVDRLIADAQSKITTEA